MPPNAWLDVCSYITRVVQLCQKTNSVTLEKLGNNKLPKAKLIERNIYILFLGQY